MLLTCLDFLDSRLRNLEAGTALIAIAENRVSQLSQTSIYQGQESQVTQGGTVMDIEPIKMQVSPAILGPQFERERDEECWRYCGFLESDIRPENPDDTMRWDDVQSEQIRQHMRQWSLHWWLERGYIMIITNEEDSSIKVEECA